MTAYHVDVIHPEHNPRHQARDGESMRCGATISLAIVCAVALVLLFPIRAFAADTPFSIDELSTELTVSPDGSIHVVEHQILTFTGQNKGYTWYAHEAESIEEVEISAVRYVSVDDGGTPTADWTELDERASNPERQGETPGDTAIESLRSKRIKPWYSYDEDDGMIRCYFPAESSSYLLEADYVVHNRVLVYRDVAELYWRYGHSSLPVESHDVTMKALLPKPQDAIIVPNQDVVAWGHGHAIGGFNVAEDASVVYHVDKLESGQYAEAHIMFPADWMTEVTEADSNSFPEVRRQSAIAEEHEWVDLSTRGANWDYEVRILFLAIAACLIFAGAICTIRFGRTYRSRLALIRIACTLGVIALFANLFFREPFTVVALAVAAAVVLVAAMLMPGPDKSAEALEYAAPADEEESAIEAPADADGADDRDSEVVEDGEDNADVADGAGESQDDDPDACAPAATIDESHEAENDTFDETPKAAETPESTEPSADARHYGDEAEALAEETQPSSAENAADDENKQGETE